MNNATHPPSHPLNTHSQQPFRTARRRVQSERAQVCLRLTIWRVCGKTPCHRLKTASSGMGKNRLDAISSYCFRCLIASVSFCFGFVMLPDELAKSLTHQDFGDWPESASIAESNGCACACHPHNTDQESAHAWLALSLSVSGAELWLFDRHPWRLP